MIDVARIEQHYRAVSEGARLQRSRARKLEFDTTLHFLDKHLSPRATLLELGAGHGAYSLHFARRGHRVVATDLVASNVQTMLDQVEQEGLGTIQVRQADATRLEALSDWDFQGVLCLGPYYHLRTRELRRRCLLECRRVVHDRGVVAVSYINRAFAVGLLLKNAITLTRDQYESLQKLDDTRTDYPDEFFNIAHFTTPEAVEAEVRSCGFEIVEHAATDGVYEYFAEKFEALSEEAYLDFFGYHLKTCTQPSQLGGSNHGLVILKKC
jgi:cyclopropane fatty-acyl-phospholipid synthase-like methyltransferase